MFAKIRILKENTPRSTAMPEGSGTFAVWPITDFSLMIGLKNECDGKWGSPNSHITPWWFCTQLEF